MRNEEDIGVEGEDGGGLFARVQVDGSSRRYERRATAGLAPGSAIRVSIGARKGRGKGLGRVARILAYIDPLTGNLVVRMGMYDITKNRRGSEVGPQVVFTSDTPVCGIDSRLV
jgi:hypothetical protein